MRNILLAIVVVGMPASIAAAEPSSLPKPDKPAASDRLLPMKGTSANSCAAFGPGFVKLAGSDTCVKVGGAVRVDVGGSR
jgi:Porin subfamily